MKRGWRRWSVVVAVQVVAVAALLEAGVRMARRFDDRVRALAYSPTVRTGYEDATTTPELLARSYFQYHPLGATEGFVLNSRGFRTHEYREAKGPGVYRVVVLGDSFAFCSSAVPYARMWHSRMGQRLAAPAADAGREVEVISLGVPSVGPRFELRMWELEGQRLRPDLVVLAFFVGNDFTDESGTDLAPAGGGWARWSVAYRVARNLYRLRSELRENPELAAAAASSGGGEPQQGGFELPSYPAAYDPERPSFTAERYLEIERGRLAICQRSRGEEFDRLFADAAEVLRRLAHEVRASGAELMVAVIPDEFQVDGELLAAILERYEVAPADVDLDRPQRRLAELFAAEGIAYVDLLPAFRARTAGGERLYKPRDSHWNAAGNALAGDELARALLARGLAPADGD